MKPNKFLTWFIPSSSLLAVVLLFILSNLQIKKEKEKFLVGNAKTLALANRVLGAYTRNSGFYFSQKGKENTLSLLKVLSYEENVNCIVLSSSKHTLSYPPATYCKSLGHSQMISTKLKYSNDTVLKLFITNQTLQKIIKKIIIENTLGGALFLIVTQLGIVFFLMRKFRYDSNESSRQVRQLIMSSPHPTLLVDSTGKIILFSNSFKSLSKSINELLGSQSSINSKLYYFDILTKHSAERIRFAIKNSVGSNIDNIPLEGIQISLSKSGQKLLYTSLLLSKINYIDEMQYMLSFNDINNLVVQRELLGSALSKDYLTQAYSRQYLIEELADGKRDCSYALFLINIDSLKVVNNRYGHSVGDQLLCNFVEKLSTFNSSNNTMIRISGDEFILLVPSDNHQELSSLAKNLYLNSSFQFNMNVDNISTLQTFSFVAIQLNILDQLSKHISLADTALSQSKKTGKNKYLVVSSQITTQSNDSEDYITLESIENAYISQEIMLYLQPVFDSKGKTIEGFEALSRWESRTNKFISPPLFLDSLYRLSMLDDCVVDHFELIKTLFVRLNKNISGWISLNINQYDLSDELFPRLLDLHQYLLMHYNRQIVFEISETTLKGTENSSETIDKISILKSSGALIALDDFGVLSSNFLSLSKLSVDIVKLDKFLVSNIENNLKNQYILKSLGNLSDSLGFSLVAEGVETAETASYLVDAGIRLHQGFYYAKALPIQTINLQYENTKNNFNEMNRKATSKEFL